MNAIPNFKGWGQEQNKELKGVGGGEEELSNQSLSVAFVVKVNTFCREHHCVH